jgi:hypothetical protein
MELPPDLSQGRKAFKPTIGSGFPVIPGVIPVTNTPYYYYYHLYIIEDRRGGGAL